MKIQSNNILQFSNISKVFITANTNVVALNNISFTVHEGESISLIGPSGSGKSTLLNILAGLENVSSGDIIVLNENLSNFTQNQLADFRSKFIGFIFQSFRLLGSLTAIENIEVPAKLMGLINARKNAEILLDQVGLIDRKNHYPNQLSGGEQQRVAIARAFSASPKILIADEPTGNLDFETAQIIQNLIFNLQKENGTTLVIATHDQELAKRTNRIISLRGGELI
jgi:putative ABC transport system ATP-binding protein